MASDSAMTVGVALIKLLEHYGVEHVFGIPGVHTIELYRGLSDSSIQHHTPRHEQGAGFMADGYARVSRKPGVCFVITGPGLCNIATPMGQALADSIPMLVISSVNDTIASTPARGMLHEMPDQQAIGASVSRFSKTLCNLQDLHNALARAFTQFTSARPGPVHLQLPVALLGAPVDLTLPELTPAEPPGVELALPEAPVDNILAAAELINASKTPLILAGGGAVPACEEVRQLAEKIDAPVHMTINARGLIPPTHELALPATCTLKSMRQQVANSDVVLALGTELADTDYDQYKDGGFAIDGSLIRCDIDPMQINNNYPATVGVVGEVKSCCSQLIEHVNAGQRQGRARTAQSMAASQAELTAEMHRHLSILETLKAQVPDCIFVGDSTQLIYSANMIFNTDKPQRWFNSSVGFGTLGYALPAATGAAIAADNKPVVCIIGDGGLQFVLGELGALKDTGLPVAVLVWRNEGYREIKTSMENANVSTVGVEFTVPDFLPIAEAYGIDAYNADNELQIAEIINRYHQAGKAVLIEVNESGIM